MKLSTFEDHPRNKRRPFEQGALDDLGNELSRRGRNCEDLGCPELDPQDPLQVDGRFNIDGRQWAIEHCRIAYDQEMVSAERYAKKELAAPLKAIAAEFEVVLSLGFHPPRRGRREPPPVDFYDDVRKRARVAAKSGRNDLEKRCQIYVRSGPPAVSMSFLTADNPLVASQLMNGLQDPLAHKRDRQLPPAKELGLAVLLLLDQVHDQSRDALSQWLFNHETLRQVLEMLPSSENIVDEIWLRAPDRSCLSLRPSDMPAVADALDYLWH